MSISSIRLPEGTLNPPSQAIVSPDQNWICYYLYIRRKCPRGAKVQGERIRKYRTFKALWVSRADGSNMRKIGEVSVSPMQKKDFGHTLAQVEWMPDGKAISFIYNDALYVVGVDL